MQATKLCQLGATDLELADFFKVTPPTIWRWQSAHPEFFSALKRGKEAADERVERALFSRATGYTHQAVKMFMPAGAKSPVVTEYQEHVPPDTTACIFWLKNRRRNDWRDRQEVDHSGTMTVEGVAEALGKLQGKDLATLEKLLGPIAAAARVTPGVATGGRARAPKT